MTFKVCSISSEDRVAQAQRSKAIVYDSFGDRSPSADHPNIPPRSVQIKNQRKGSDFSAGRFDSSCRIAP